ncbi:hypothetical protein TspCOW1_12780 [Thiohalobacter sp. COW1]|uniref:hypothetical protein n=1 Tax=Thiohalobacter sp. COW1 TaxID=2795687 RepID=UPI0019169C2D|nr:hypothetical protein [Thiohalobacter sp. COW1]BCO31175.1 hypothetical protein TspCOW1_12780 [Thiohalobacter sp. COW1]
MNYIATLILEALIEQGHDDAYIEEKRIELSGHTGKFCSLLSLNCFDADTTRKVADKVGVPVDDLKTTLHTIREF